ncbi:MAG: DUF5123 domain-containing protein [Prolixibacteraceae bacterium]|nr:DUF5123 domain-containing protein [Prolixibacteraceae bacterium]
MKKIYTLSMAIMLSLTMLYAQNEVVVNVGEDIISKVAEVEAGGTLLIMPGVHKASYANILVDKSMTIKNAGGINDTRVHINQIDVPANGVSLTIEGIIWSGAEVDSLTGVETVSEGDLEGDYFLNFISGESQTFGDIVVKNCIINHFNRSAIRGDRDSYYAKNIRFENCILNDYRGGGDYGPFRMKSKITFDKFELVNCTMYNIPNKLIDLQDMADFPCEVKINHCTFYNWGGGKTGQYLFDIRSNQEASLMISNSIFGKTMVEEEVTVNGWRVADPDGNAIKNNEISFTVMSPDFILDAGTYAETTFNKKEYNYDMDPGFTDPENGNFQIPDGSDLFQMSSEGTLVGDPRWATGPVSAEKWNLPEIKVYPTIVSDMVYIDMDQHVTASLKIYSSQGKLVKTIDAIAGSSAIDVSDFQRGSYFILVGQEYQQTFRFLKK